MNEVAAATVSEYIARYCYDAEPNWPAIERQKVSYKNFVAMEILEKILESPYDDDCDIIAGEYLTMCEIIAEETANRDLRECFKAGAETAKDIMHALLDSEYLNDYPSDG